MTTETQPSLPTPLGKVLAFLNRLEAVKLWYRLSHVRDSIMVSVFVPGEMWEVEFFEDGHIEIKKFISTGSVEDITDDELVQLIAEWSD